MPTLKDTLNQMYGYEQGSQPPGAEILPPMDEDIAGDRYVRPQSDQTEFKKYTAHGEGPITVSNVDREGNRMDNPESDVVLQDTVLYDDPEIARLEAETTKDRYGGSTIQDYAQKQEQQTAKGPPDLSRRGDFENSVFKQHITPNMPDGNPFRLNVVAQTNVISKRDLPDLFERVFQGQVSWQDRHLLDDEQRKFWLEKTKEYRAHVNTGLKAERAAAISSYNQMMNQFDNARKEQQAATAAAESKQKAGKETLRKFQKGTQDLTKEKIGLLKDRTKLIQQIYDYERDLPEKDDLTKKPLTAEEKDLIAIRKESAAAQLDGINARLNTLSAEIKSRTPAKAMEIPKITAPRLKRKISGPRLTASHGPTAAGKKTAGGVKKKVPAGQETGVTYGMFNGRKVIRYPDGRKAYVE